MPLRVFATPKPHRHPSLFGELLDWLLAPLLILWPLSMAVEYSLAYRVASATYDREIRDQVTVVARHLDYTGGALQLAMSRPAKDMLVADEGSERFIQVRDSHGTLVDGDAAMAAVDFSPELVPNRVYFRDDQVANSEVRVAYMFAQVSGMPGAALVQVAETDERRALLASNIIGSVLVAQFVLLPVALVLVWLGLSKGIAPLNELADRLRSRKPHDLSPIDPADAPEEVQPFVKSINDLMSRLESSLRSQQRFVSDAAHQMRTPLAGLRTQAELALRQKDLDSLQHTMRQIAGGAERASRLVTQLLALARAEGDAPMLSPLDLGELAATTASAWVPFALERGVDLGFENAQEPCLILGNAVLLQEMVNNLLDNAIRYGGSRVTVRLRGGKNAVLEIEDDGAGIPADERELVFERFYRVMGTRTDGTGLGLPIVRGITYAHHGSVQLLPGNANGTGTIVRATFPRHDAQPLQQAA